MGQGTTTASPLTTQCSGETSELLGVPPGWAPCAGIVAEYAGYPWFLTTATPEWFSALSRLRSKPPQQEVDRLAADWVRSRDFAAIKSLWASFRVRPDSREDIVADAVAETIATLSAAEVRGLVTSFESYGGGAYQWARRAAYLNNIAAVDALWKYRSDLDLYINDAALMSEFWRGAATGGHLDTLQCGLLAKYEKKGRPDWAIVAAAAAGQVPCMRWLYLRVGANFEGLGVVAQAAVTNNQLAAAAEIRSWVPGVYPARWTLLQLAAKHASAAVLGLCWEWCGQSAAACELALEDAAAAGKLEAVVWCFGRGARRVRKAFQAAAAGGHLRVCELCWRRSDGKCDATRGFVRAAKGRHVAVMAFCYARGADLAEADKELQMASLPMGISPGVVDDFREAVALLAPLQDTVRQSSF